MSYWIIFPQLVTADRHLLMIVYLYSWTSGVAEHGFFYVRVTLHLWQRIQKLGMTLHSTLQYSQMKLRMTLTNDTDETLDDSDVR